MVGEDEPSAEFGDAKGRRKTERPECVYSTLPQQGHTEFCRGIFFGGWGPGLRLHSIFMTMRMSVNLPKSQFSHTRTAGKFTAELCSALSPVLVQNKHSAIWHCQQRIIRWWCY